MRQHTPFGIPAQIEGMHYGPMKGGGGKAAAVVVSGGGGGGAKANPDVVQKLRETTWKLQAHNLLAAANATWQQANRIAEATAWRKTLQLVPGPARAQAKAIREAELAKISPERPKDLDHPVARDLIKRRNIAGDVLARLRKAAGI